MRKDQSSAHHQAARFARRTSRIRTRTEDDSMGQTLQQDDLVTNDHVRDVRKTERQRLTSMTTSRDMSGAKADNTFCNHVHGGELNAHELHKDGQVEVWHLSRMCSFSSEHHIKLRSLTCAEIPSRFAVQTHGTAVGSTGEA